MIEHLALFNLLSPTNKLSNRKVKPCSIPSRQGCLIILYHEESHGWVTCYAWGSVFSGDGTGFLWTCTAVEVNCVQACKAVLGQSSSATEWGMCMFTWANTFLNANAAFPLIQWGCRRDVLVYPYDRVSRCWMGSESPIGKFPTWWDWDEKGVLT